MLRGGDPEPPDGTPLLDSDGRVEPYESAALRGRWQEYVVQMGPFVVAPDFDELVNGE